MSFDYDSQWWQEERERVLFHWKGLCERCNFSTESPHVHHKYGINKQIYEVLCPECHAEHHNNPEIEEKQSEWEKKYFCKHCDEEIYWEDDPEFGWLPYNENNDDLHKCIGKKKIKQIDKKLITLNNFLFKNN